MSLRSLVVLVLIVGIFGAEATAFSADIAGIVFRNDTSLSSSVHRSPEKVTSYLTAKYHDICSVDVYTTVTRNGLSGKMFVSGEIVPQKVPSDLPAEADKVARARAISKAFIQDETDLFGIVDLNEIKESTIGVGEGFGGGYVYVNFDRVINGITVEGDQILIVVGPSEKIMQIQAHFVPVPPEAYEASTRKTLSSDDIASIVRQDQASHGINTENRVYKIHKCIVEDKPYVIYLVPSLSTYAIDAFSGEILKKQGRPRKGPKTKKQ